MAQSNSGSMDGPSGLNSQLTYVTDPASMLFPEMYSAHQYKHGPQHMKAQNAVQTAKRRRLWTRSRETTVSDQLLARNPIMESYWLNGVGLPRGATCAPVS